MKLLCRACAMLVLLTLVGSAAADDSVSIKVRLQPRFDLGEFESGKDAGVETQLDIYMRRSRLEFRGQPFDGVTYNVTVSGDRAGQRGSAGGADLRYAYFNYRLTPAFQLRAGRAKLSFSRGGMVSSSKMLIIDRSGTGVLAAAAIGDYITPHLTLHGRVRDGAIGYGIGLKDGVEPGDTDSRFSQEVVSASDNPGVVFRFEVSPDGWVEGRESASHLGEGRHLTLAFNGVVQNGIEFDTATEDRLVLGGDLSFHNGPITLLVEYLLVDRDRDGKAVSSPAGMYVQAGYYTAGFGLEPVARFERIDSDLPGGSDVTTTFTGGLNWYRHGHSLKFMANIVHVSYQRSVRPIDGEGSSTMLQMQSQMYF